MILILTNAENAHRLDEAVRLIVQNVPSKISIQRKIRSSNKIYKYDTWFIFDTLMLRIALADEFPVLCISP